MIGLSKSFEFLVKRITVLDDNGYIVIKNAVPKEQAKKQQIFYGNLKKKILITLIHGMKL